MFARNVTKQYHIRLTITSMTTGRNPSALNAMDVSQKRTCTEEFVRHRIFEYGYRYATLCKLCSSWEIGQKMRCGNQSCRATGMAVRHIEAQWSNTQAHYDKLNEFCVVCRHRYIQCSCEWKRKYVMWKKYETSLQNEFEERKKLLFT